MESEWITPRHAAELLGVKPQTLAGYANRGVLTADRTPGGHRRFLKSDVDAYVERRSILQRGFTLNGSLSSIGEA